MGVCIGAHITVIPMIVGEMSPSDLTGPMGVVNQFMFCLGVLLEALLGFMVPYSSDQAIETTMIWIVIYSMPIFLGILQIVLFLAVFRYDTPRWYELQGDKANYDAAMKACYYSRSSTQYSQSLLTEEKEEEKEVEPEDVTWAELFSAPKNRSLCIVMLVAFFHQATGISTLTYFTNELFGEGKTGDEAEFAGRIGALVISVVSLLGTVAAFKIAHHYGRRYMIFHGVNVLTFFLAFNSISVFLDNHFFALLGII